MDRDLVTNEDCKKALSNLVTDVRSENGQEEIRKLQKKEILDDKEMEILDKYITKTKRITQMYSILTQSNSISEGYLNLDEIAWIDRTKIDLYKHKLNSLVMRIELDWRTINWLLAHLTPTKEELDRINQYKYKLQEIGGLYKFLVKGEHIENKPYNLRKLRKLQNLESRMVE